MPDPVGFDSARTGAPDGTTGIFIPTILAMESTSLEIPTGIALTDVVTNTVLAHRAGIAGPDTATDMSSAGFGNTGTALTNNRGALVVWCEFGSSTAAALLTPVFYDNAAAQAPTALGLQMYFPANAAFRVSSGNDYMTAVQITDTYGFRRYKMYVNSLTNGSVDVFAAAI